MNDHKRTLRRFWPLYATLAAVLALTFGFLGAGSASATIAPPVPGNITVLPAAPRLVPGPGHHLANAQEQLQVSGKVGVPVGSTGVLIDISAVSTQSTGSLRVWAADAGQPGPATLTFTAGHDSSVTGIEIGLNDAGRLNVSIIGSANYVLAVKGFITPVASAKPSLDGAYYSQAQYDVGDTNGGAVATVACKATTDVAISGAAQTLAVGTNGLTGNVPVSSSFPGRMDWSTNTPLPNRLDGWIFQFGGNSSTTSLGDPKYVTLKTLCVPGADISVVNTFVESSG